MHFPNVIMPCKAIWLNDLNNKDEYADFYPDIQLQDGKQYLLRIVCDTDKAVYLGEELISFGQFADYPDTPVYDEILFQGRTGKTLKITAWHSGIDSQTHIATKAYIAFCIYENGNLIYSSSEDTFVCPSPLYIPYLCNIITVQMGAGFSLRYNNNCNKLSKSSEIDISFNTLRKRPINQLELANCIFPVIVRSGMFTYTENNDSALMMKNAILDSDGYQASGKYFLFDLGKEYVGFPEIIFNSSTCGIARVGWGEHIKDGMCRCAIGSRRFTFDITYGKGYNEYFPVLRRIGCRYLQIFIDDINVENIKLKFHPVLLPTKIIKKEYNGDKAKLRQKIRNTAIRTLECCMHEHYEDCPWREQALYTLDSRNQMLAGYMVFEDKNADFVRANLDLISRGVRHDGILALCYPAGLDYPIPFYTLAYFMQMQEYIDNIGDITLAQEKFEILTSLLSVFYSKIDDIGLIPRFPDSEGYWNFYEWSKYLSGDRIHKDTPNKDLPYEAILNAALSIASRSMSKICLYLGKHELAKFYENTADSLAYSISKVFFDSDRGLFFDFTDRPELQPSALTQAMCLLCGAADELDQTYILEAIARNGGIINNVDVIPATLSMACFRYNALLKTSNDRFKHIILDEIDRDCQFMLNNDATTFWETLKGESDFSQAGSLCHGWSAMAAYYYELLL